MTRSPGRPFVIGTFAIMFLTAEVAAIGTAVPTIARVTGVDAALVGQLAVAHGLGVLLGILLWGRVQGHWPTRRALVLGLASMLLGAVAVVVSPAAHGTAVVGDGRLWLLALGVSMFVVGAGFGVLVTAVNTVAAQADMSPGMLNALHGTFGIGAIGFPVLAGRTDLATVFLVVAVLTVGAGPLLLRRTPTVRRAPTHSTAGRAALPFAVFVAFAVGLEIGISVWAPTHLVAAGYSVGTAATVVGAFFAAFTTSRFLVAPFIATWDLGRLVRWATLGAGLAALAASVSPLLAWVVAGVGIGPLFPTTLAWMTRATGDDRAATRLYTGAMIGGLVSPAVLGAVIGFVGVSALPVVLALVALVGWVLARSLPDVEVPVPAGRSR